MFTRAFGSLALIVLATGTFAADESAKAIFPCYTIADLADVSGSIGKAAVNNLNINEGSSVMLGGLTELRLSYAVANRNDVAVYASVDAIFRDASDNPIAAVSATPSFGSVGAGKTESVERGTIVNPGTLPKVRSVCIRMSGAVANR